MNIILNDIIRERKGHYCHALEVETVYDLESTIEQIFDHFSERYEVSEIIEFFDTISICSLSEDEEEEEKIYNFDINEYLLTF